METTVENTAKDAVEPTISAVNVSSVIGASSRRSNL